VLDSRGMGGWMVRLVPPPAPPPPPLLDVLLRHLGPKQAVVVDRHGRVLDVLPWPPRGRPR
jgi:hypothetical protein